MSKVEKFIASTDYATLKNDSTTTTITVSIPATAIAAGAIQTYDGTGTVGTTGSPIEYDINYSMSTRRHKTSRMDFVENSGGATQYEGNIFVYKSAANTVKVFVTVHNGKAISITKIARTVTVRVRTFIPPFS